MKQITFSDFEYAEKRKQTRKEFFLFEMERVVPWKGLVVLTEPYFVAIAHIGVDDESR